MKCAHCKLTFKVLVNHEAFCKLNPHRDVDFSAWASQLTDEGLEAKRLEVLAFKLAMNVATAGTRHAHDVMQKRRAGEISRARRLQHLLKDAKLPSDIDLTESQVLKIRSYMKRCTTSAK